MQYLYGIRYLALQFGGTDTEFIEGELVFRAASNASFADDVATRRSTQGFLFQVLGGIVNWKSSKQDLVSTLTTEAELKAISAYAAWLIWWQRLFDIIDLDLPNDDTILCDNL